MHRVVISLPQTCLSHLQEHIIFCHLSTTDTQRLFDTGTHCHSPTVTFVTETQCHLVPSFFLYLRPRITKNKLAGYADDGSHGPEDVRIGFKSTRVQNATRPVATPMRQTLPTHQSPESVASAHRAISTQPCVAQRLVATPLRQHLLTQCHDPPDQNDADVEDGDGALDSAEEDEESSNENDNEDFGCPGLIEEPGLPVPQLQPGIRQGELGFNMYAQAHMKAAGVPLLRNGLLPPQQTVSYRIPCILLYFCEGAIGYRVFYGTL